jgi:hypothetical protein
MARSIFLEYQRDSAFVVWLKRATIAFLAVHGTLALLSGHRAIWQIRSVEVTVPDIALRPGSLIRANIVTSGRVEADVSLDLVQGPRVTPLGVRYVARNHNASWDPRSRRASLTVVVTDEMLARFTPGPAVVRATGHGNPQWLRTPPPTVREVAVRLQPNTP